LGAAGIYVYHPFPHLLCCCFDQTTLPCPFLPTHDIIPPTRTAAAAAAAAAVVGEVGAEEGEDVAAEGGAEEGWRGEEMEDCVGQLEGGEGGNNGEDTRE